MFKYKPIKLKQNYCHWTGFSKEKEKLINTCVMYKTNKYFFLIKTLYLTQFRNTTHFFKTLSGCKEKSKLKKFSLTVSN